jgi:hypothetical protein
VCKGHGREEKRGAERHFYIFLVITFIFIVSRSSAIRMDTITLLCWKYVPAKISHKCRSLKNINFDLFIAIGGVYTSMHEFKGESTKKSPNTAASATVILQSNGPNVTRAFSL